MEIFIDLFGKDLIKSLTDRREFVGKQQLFRLCAPFVLSPPRLMGDEDQYLPSCRLGNGEYMIFVTPEFTEAAVMDAPFFTTAENPPSII